MVQLATTLVYLSFILWVTTSASPTFLNAGNITYKISEYKDSLNIQFDVGKEGRLVKITGPNIKTLDNDRIVCTKGSLVHWMLEMEKQQRLFNISFNISCQMDQDVVKHLTIRSLKTVSNSKEIELVLENESDGISKYIVYYMNNQSVFSKVVLTNDNSFMLRNLSEETLYQICVAAIDNTSRSGYYKCVQERTSFTTTGPVTNITVTTFHDRIKVSWNKPEYEHDIPQGYIVNYYGSERCRSIIINMGHNRIPNDTQCSVSHVKYWQHLQVLTIGLLTHDSTYNIDIKPYIEDKESVETTVSTQTKKIDQSGLSFSALGTFNYVVMQMETQNIMYFHYNVEVMEIEILDRNKSLNNENSVLCQENEKIHLNLTLKIEDDELNIPYNISCQFTRKDNKIVGMTAKSNGSSIVVSWEISKGSLVSLVYYDGRRSHQIVRQSEPVDLFELKHVHEKSNYTICMATINSTDLMATSPLKCTNIITDFLKSGPIQNLETMASDHMILLKWQDPEYELDRPQGYVLKYINKMNMCRAILINEVNDEFVKSQSCGNVKRINTKIQQNYIPISSLEANMQYTIEIIPYNHGRTPLKTTSTIRTTNENCFYDCRADNYAGLRTTSSSGKPCSRWNESTLGRNNHFQCDVPQCNELTKASGCVSDIEYDTTVFSITVSWEPPQYSGQIKGYITLLHKDNTCVQAHVQTCEDCPKKFTKNILNFYQSCQRQMVNLRIKYESVFDNVKEDHAYSVFIIPILDESTSGAILNISVKTKLNTKEIDTIENPENLERPDNLEKPKTLDKLKKLKHLERPEKPEESENPDKTNEKESHKNKGKVIEMKTKFKILKHLLLKNHLSTKENQIVKQSQDIQLKKGKLMKKKNIPTSSKTFEKPRYFNQRKCFYHRGYMYPPRTLIRPRPCYP